jgi:hypothetical protein
MPTGSMPVPRLRVIAWLLVLLFGAVCQAQDARQILVKRSDGTPVLAASGMEVRGYAGSSWRESAVFEGSGLFRFNDATVNQAMVILNGIPSALFPLGTTYDLVDFAIQVTQSPFAGGDGRNVNEVRLYQGDNWRANLVQQGPAGEYHIDVVDGIDLRAYVIKDGMGRMTPTVRPADSDAIDTGLQLVDFAIQVTKSPFAGGDGRNVNEVRLYQGDNWRANLVQQGGAGEYHIDVVDGIDLRAYVIKDGMGRMTPTVRPADSDAIDTGLQLVDFAIQVTKSPFAGGDGRNVNEVRLYQGDNWRANLVQQGPAGEYHIDVVDGIDLRAYVIKDGMGRMTPTVRPADSDAIDTGLQLVDFAIQVTKSPFAGGDGRNVNEVRLYQGDNWRANLVQQGGAGEYHIDVVDGIDLRAYVIKDGMGAMTPTVRPADSDAIDTGLQLVDFAIQVTKSPFAGGDGRNVNEVRLYQGDNWRANLVQQGGAGEYHIDVVDGIDLRAYVIKDGMGRMTPTVRPADSDAIDTGLQLVDFRLDVLSSAYRGGQGVSVNEVRLYQGDNWRANLAQQGPAGEYHIDVVDGIDVRGYVIKDGLGAFTPAARPSLASGRDTSLELVDYHLALDSEDCQAVPLGEVRLYQGNNWRANFGFVSPTNELHHDVVPGVELRAWLSRSGLGVFSPTVQPQSVEDGPDQVLKAPTVRFTTDQSGSQARLYEGSTHRLTLGRGGDGSFSTPLVEGMGGLRFWINNVYSPTFTVSDSEGPLASDGSCTISLAVDACWNLGSGGSAAVVLQDLQATPGPEGSLTLSWQVSETAALQAFHIQRDGMMLDRAVPVIQGVNRYEFQDSLGNGAAHYRIWGANLAGGLDLLADLDHEGLPARFGLAEAWPNPFNPSTRLGIVLDRERSVRLAVYDLRGALVATVHQGLLPAGEHRFTFQAGGLASGIYLARLESEGQGDTRRLMLVK